MLRLRQDVEAPGQLRRQIVIEEESHAAEANFSSNSSASLTSLAATSYQRATSSITPPLALTLSVRTLVGMLVAAELGWPKLRSGSTTTVRSRPSGHHRTKVELSANS